MRLHQLSYFVAVAETRHFTRAADRVRVAQPSLSRQIQSLEASLGAPLLERGRGGVTLTAAGEALLPIARRILADVEMARREVAELVGLRRGRVRVGATPSLCVSLLGDVLRRFRTRYPAIEMVVAENGSRDLVRDLSRGSLDLALVILTAPDPLLAYQPILAEDLVVASATDAAWPAVDAAPIAVADLRGRPLVMFRRGYDLREATLTACRAAGFTPELATDGGEMDAVLRFTEAGLGVAVVPSMVLAGRPGLRATPLAPPGLRRTIALAHRSEVELPHAARAFRDTLLGYVTEATAAGSLPRGVVPVTPS